MGDVVTKLWQMGLEGGYTSNAASAYNGGTTLPAKRRIATEKGIKADWKPVFESPEEARGAYAGSYTHTMHMMSVTGNLPAQIYADDQIMLCKMLVSGAPVVVPLPASPQSLLAAATINASMGLTTQPNLATDGGIGKMLQIVLANTVASTAPVNVVVTGTDIYGVSLTETVSFPAGTTTPSYTGGGTGGQSVTLWTNNFFATVTSLTTSAQPTGDTIAVFGINGFFYTFTSDMGVSTLQSACAEYWDGSAAWQIPGVVLGKGSWNAQIGKSFKFDGTVEAKNKQLLPATSSSINAASATGAHDALTTLRDNILATIPTYQTRFYSDVQGAIPGSTQLPGRLIDFKLDADMGAKLGKAADGTPYATFVARDFYGAKLMAELTLLFNSYTTGSADPMEVVRFLQNQSRTLMASFPGPALPCGPLNVAGGWPLYLQQNSVGGYYGMAFALSGHYTDCIEKSVDGRAAYGFKLHSEVDIQTMGAPLQVSVVSRINPNN